jgi:hypothetical protein
MDFTIIRISVERAILNDRNITSYKLPMYVLSYIFHIFGSI